MEVALIKPAAPLLAGYRDPWGRIHVTALLISAP